MKNQESELDKAVREAEEELHDRFWSATLPIIGITKSLYVDLMVYFVIGGSLLIVIIFVLLLFGVR